MTRACTRREQAPGTGGRARAPRPRAIVLAPRHLARIEKHARAAYPAECCGMLLGAAGEHTVVSSVHPATNLRAETARDRYEIDPREMLALDRAATEQGREIVGFYHSHPDHPPAPSATDVASAWPGYVYLIVAVNGGGPATRSAGSLRLRSEPALSKAKGQAGQAGSRASRGTDPPLRRAKAAGSPPAKSRGGQAETTAWTYDDHEGRFDELAIRPAAK